ncbi:molybdate ABC transporter substrate-binding protein [Arthrobacter livingstonensis]|uniref:Molybdate-binding protein ModA n=1 Tax=Arthrobacter livingstonensis TaxID=670078 RepID=A0A2V5LF41_9MICC|nr:molybdate ABC transporter substrate-binding protein [Arthrobacter livingstonensis]PYI69304.1 molybdate ABC transporter substrate-binding protein [Arthrobacter livingstonensis]
MRKMFRKPAAAAAAILVAVSLAACGGSAGSTGISAAPGSTPALSGTLTVFAAASLKPTFTELAATFEKENPAVKVSLNFDGSSTLVSQITQGAPADVFASADQANMTKLSDAKLVSGSPAIFATNVLTIVVPPNNPANITTFADLAKPGVKVVVCAAQVPCGAAAKSDEASAGVVVKPVSEELNVTSVLGKVTSGEADAGLVYVTDATTAGDKVKTVPLKLEHPTVNKYPIAAVSTSKNQEPAKAFIALVTGPSGQKVLGDAGFGTP